MARRPLSSQNSADRFLIAEQPGMPLLVTGVLIALFLGLVFRAALSPARVRRQIEKAAGQIHRDVHVQFESAEFSLSDGILPRFSVLISNVVMESSQECWMSPRLETNQIRLPLSLWGLATGGSVIREIDADQVKLTLRGEYRDCGSGKISAAPGAPVQLIRMDPAGGSAGSETPANFIQEISFAGLEIDWLRDPRAHLEFQDVEFKVRALEPRWYVLQAKTSLFRDEQVGDYLSHANLYVEYKEAPETTVQLHFFGNWREGHYSFVGNYNARDRSLILESDLKHIPLRQIIQLAQRYRWANVAINPKNVWLSLHSGFTGKLADIAHAPWEISEFHLEGDLGDIRADRATLRSLDPLKFEDLRLDLQKVALDKILNLFLMESPAKIFGNLGEFTGRAEVDSTPHIRLFGDWSGLEFIFSNKGQREVQKIAKIRTEVDGDRERWKLDLSRVQPEQGVFDGSLQIRADSKLKNVDLRLRLNEARLSPGVEKLMTQDGRIGAISSQLDFSMQDGKLSRLKGNVRAADLLIEGIGVSTPRAHLDFAQNEILISLSGDALKVSPQSAAYGVVGFLAEPLSIQGGLQFGNFAGQFRTLNFKTLQWKNMRTRTAASVRLSTEGGWDDQGRLQGRILLNNRSQSRIWAIGGTREAPVISERSGGH